MTTTTTTGQTSGVAHVTNSRPQASHWMVFGVGVLGMLWLATTSFAPVVLAFLIAAVIYQGIHKGAAASFFGWLD